MDLINLLKGLPVDLGQGTLRGTTKGKLIAMTLVPVGNNGTALDAGCREGTQTRWLEGRGYRVVSVDLEQGMPGALKVDLEKPLPFASGEFDLVWCSEVIEHLANPEEVVREFRRILKPGGRMILTTPNSGFWLYPLVKPFGLTPQRLQQGPQHEIRHKQFFVLPDISRLFPSGNVWGYFPYALVKFTITRFVGLLSPTFIVREIKK